MTSTHKGTMGIPNVSAESLEVEAEQLLVMIDPNYLIKPQKIDVDDLLELDLKMKIDYLDFGKDSDVLGMITFSDGIVYGFVKGKRKSNTEQAGTIIVSNRISEDEFSKIRRFVEIHEFGHWLIHKDYCGEWKRSSILAANAKCVNPCYRFDEISTPNDDLRMDWQADYFASAFLIPRTTLKITMKKLMERYGWHEMPLQDMLHMKKYPIACRIVEDVSDIYEVEEDVVAMRLYNLGYFPRGLARQLVQQYKVKIA